MNDLGFSMFGTVAGLVAVGFITFQYLRIYRRIPSLESFTTSEKNILSFQLLAMLLWTIVGLGIFFYGLWFDNRMETLFKRPINIVIAISNWMFFGFIAATSFFPGVSILSSIRSWNLHDPVKGRDSFLWGIAILALLFYWTWKVFLPNL